VWSHFASSETDPVYTKKQYQIFKMVVALLKQQGIDPPLKHMSCTAAAINFSLNNFNAIRLGLGLYGLYSSPESREKIKLLPALSWKTKIIQVKTLPANTRVGYGGTFKTWKPTKIAILPVGYWDGYDRRFSNNAFVLVRGKKCSVRGRICMNLIMVDVSEVLNVKVGDEVILIGKDKTEVISVDDLAKWAKTINYEIVDRINPLLPRIVI
jgi:alanine racemase